jgi:hypothetical protein
VQLGTDWRELTIDVAGRDLSRVIRGFMFVTNAQHNASSVSIYLASIIWE